MEELRLQRQQLDLQRERQQKELELLEKRQKDEAELRKLEATERVRQTELLFQLFAANNASLNNTKKL
jgi:hypothetical protein